MSAQMNDRQLLQAVSEAVKNDARTRAQFWHLGQFTNTQAGQVAARIALATIVGDAIADEITGKLLLEITTACGALRASYQKAGDSWEVTDNTAPLRIAQLLPTLVAWEYDRRSAMSPVAANALGKIVVDGMNAVRLKQPVRRCAWCHSIFIAQRSDALFCAPQCRTNAGVKVHRERKAK